MRVRVCVSGIDAETTRRESVVLPGLYSGLEISLSVSTLLASRVVSWKIRKNGGGNGRRGRGKRRRR